VAGSDDGFDRVTARDPGRVELEHIAVEHGLPLDAVLTGLVHPSRPRVELHGSAVSIVLRHADYHEDEEAVELEDLLVVVGPSTLVTVDARGSGPSRGATEDEGPGAAAIRIVREVLSGYADVIDQLESDVDDIEVEVFSPERGSHARRIHRLRRQIQALRRAVGPLPEQFASLTAARVPAHLAGLAGELDRLAPVAGRLAEHVSHLDELLNSVLQAHLAGIGIRQNDDMRRISAWVAIVAAPTAMASIYGMNFRHMPELTWRLGYPAVLLTMAVICGLLYRAFRRSGWL
jgi:magnesium transporter